MIKTQLLQKSSRKKEALPLPHPPDSSPTQTHSSEVLTLNGLIVVLLKVITSIPPMNTLVSLLLGS